MSTEPIIALGMPRRSNTVSFGAARGYFWPASTENPVKVNYLDVSPCSLLNHNFDRLWAAALNARDSDRATHFAMIHDDVWPDGVWLAELLELLTERDADIVSSVIALKDERGLTSTAVCYGDIWTRRRITVKEALELPETFGGEDVGGQLLLNTGLWMCDLRKPWCDKINFGSLERICVHDGKRVAEVVSEDWLFSYRLHEMLGNPRLYATRKIGVKHAGQQVLVPSDEAGLWETDSDYWRYTGLAPHPIVRECKVVMQEAAA